MKSVDVTLIVSLSFTDRLKEEPWRGRSKDKKQGSDGTVDISYKSISALAKHEMWCMKTYRQLAR